MMAPAVMVLVYVPIGMKEQTVELNREQSFLAHMLELLFLVFLTVRQTLKL
jgi:hypothetical protein